MRPGLSIVTATAHTQLCARKLEGGISDEKTVSEEQLLMRSVHRNFHPWKDGESRSLENVVENQIKFGLHIMKPAELHSKRAFLTSLMRTNKT